ncbi:hypothetical protein SLA2020_001510 [Shorea laevis]
MFCTINPKKLDLFSFCIFFSHHPNRREIDGYLFLPREKRLSSSVTPLTAYLRSGGVLDPFPFPGVAEKHRGTSALCGMNGD